MRRVYNRRPSVEPLQATAVDPETDWKIRRQPFAVRHDDEDVLVTLM